MSSQTIGGPQRRPGTVPRIAGGDATPLAATGSRPPVPFQGPVPPPRRLAGLCAWAALLGFLGIIVGARGLVAILVKAPSWYEPTLIGIGLGGVGLTVLAFLTVHIRHVPWVFLFLSTGALVAAIVATSMAT